MSQVDHNLVTAIQREFGDGDSISTGELTLIAEVSRLRSENYSLRDIIRQQCIEDDDICPECGSEQVHTWRSTAAECNLGDGSGMVCGDCDHQWGES